MTDMFKKKNISINVEQVKPYPLANFGDISMLAFEKISFFAIIFMLKGLKKNDSWDRFGSCVHREGHVLHVCQLWCQYLN